MASLLLLHLELSVKCLGIRQNAAGNVITRRNQTSALAAAECNGGSSHARSGRRSFCGAVAMCRMPSAAFKCGHPWNGTGKLVHDSGQVEEKVVGNVQVFGSYENLNRGEGCCGEASLNKMAGMAAAFLIGLSLLLHEEAASAGTLTEFVPAAFPWEKAQEQLEPSKGTCATCIGVVDETLGSCNATTNCVSSFDDRPRFFVAPWEFPGKLPVAVKELRDALLRIGASIEEQGERYVHAVFTSKDGVVDDVEFLFSNPREDATVVLRSASRATNVDDQQRNKKRLEEIRKYLTWEQVPVLRNRKRTFFFLESPWDSFGPEPPPSFDYKNDLEVVPE